MGLQGGAPDWLLGVQVVGSETNGNTPAVAKAPNLLNTAVNFE